MTDIKERNDAERADLPMVSASPWDRLNELEAWMHRLSPRASVPGLVNVFDGIDFTPLADVEETASAWTIEVELPGVKKKDIDVQTHGRTIVISGERKEKQRAGALREKRRLTGTFRYEVGLPGVFNSDEVSARLSDGELTVTVPKTVDEHSHRVIVG